MRAVCAAAIASLLALPLPAVRAASSDEVAEAWQDVREQAQEAGAATRRYAESATRNAWLHGQLEAAYLLNRHLDNFAIDSRVQDGVVYLQGVVGSPVEKELAEEIALGIEGVRRVENGLVVDAEAAQQRQRPESEGRSFADRFHDATITASVKSRLLMNEGVGALTIDVDTLQRIVTLRGRVQSAQEKELAEQVAAGVENVEAVRNELVVASSEEP